MRELDQFQIIEEVLERAMDYTEDGFKELIINYLAEDYQSNLRPSYLIEKNGREIEVSLLNAPGFDSAGVEAGLYMLRNHLAQANRPKFSSCQIHVTSDGKYEAKYGYDDIDWDTLPLDGTNFPGAK